MGIYNIEQKDLNPAFLDTEFLIEANFFERFALWKENDFRIDSGQFDTSVVWEEKLLGIMQIVGTYHRRPIVVYFSWAKLDGHLISFYYPTSLLVDHGMIEKFLKQHCNPMTKDGRRAHVDAMNFHNCIIPLKRGELLSFRETISRRGKSIKKGKDIK